MLECGLWFEFVEWLMRRHAKVSEIDALVIHYFGLDASNNDVWTSIRNRIRKMSLDRYGRVHDNTWIDINTGHAKSLRYQNYSFYRLYVCTRTCVFVSVCVCGALLVVWNKMIYRPWVSKMNASKQDALNHV